MRAYFLELSGTGTRLAPRDVPVPEEAPGQVLVRVRAAGLNRGEFIVGHGRAKPGAARPAGNEAAAEVVHDMLVAQGQLKAGEWLLVTGVSSGVGVAALQAAKALGANVIGTSGSAEKLNKLKSVGLDAAIHTRKGDFHDAVMKATDAKGANLAVNTVGGSVFAECVRSLGFEGRLAIVGYVDGVLKGEIDLEAVHAKRLRIFGVSNKLRNAAQRASTVQGFVADFLPLFASGSIKPLIDRVFPFAELPAAKAYMESDAHVGKIIVTGP